MGSLLTHRKTKNYKISFSDIITRIIIKQMKPKIPYLNFLIFLKFISLLYFGEHQNISTAITATYIPELNC